MPYGQVREPMTRWPVPNRLFDPQQAVRVAAQRFEEVELADRLGFDWIGDKQVLSRARLGVSA